MVDIELVNKCKTGNRAAFKDLYESCAPYLHRVIQRYANRQEDRKDVLQESFTKIFMYLPKFDQSKGEFKSWITKIAINESFKLLNQKKKKNHLNVPYDENRMEQMYFPDYEALTKKDLDKYLKKMPERYRLVFLLSEVDGYSHKEIGNLLQIKEATSRSQLTRAKNWIKKELLPELKVHLDGAA